MHGLTCWRRYNQSIFITFWLGNCLSLSIPSVSGLPKRQQIGLHSFCSLSSRPVQQPVSATRSSWALQNEKCIEMFHNTSTNLRYPNFGPKKPAKYRWDMMGYNDLLGKWLLYPFITFYDTALQNRGWNDVDWFWSRNSTNASLPSPESPSSCPSHLPSVAFACLGPASSAESRHNLHQLTMFKATFFQSSLWCKFL